MTFWQIFGLAWFLDRKNPKEAEKPNPHTDIDFEPKWETCEPPKGRKISGYLSFAFLVAAIVCFCTGHFLFALLLIFALSGSLVWPYI
jgi:hypothetical protein